ncbi:MAG: putative Ig domain-containing protein [Planctomycetales bacterium]
MHLFLTAGQALSDNTSFQLTLYYADGSSSTSPVATVPDWFHPVTESQSRYNLIRGMDREKANLTQYQDANAATIFGFRFAADANRQLSSLEVTPVNVPGTIVFFGATGVVPNHAPTLPSISHQNVNEQHLLAVAVTATDPDGGSIPFGPEGTNFSVSELASRRNDGTLTYSLEQAPEGSSINATTGLFTWSPTEAQGPGDYTVAVRVTDHGSPALSAVTSFGVRVNEVNLAPTLANPGNQSVDELTPLIVALSATDPDLPPNLLTYVIEGGFQEGMSLDPVTGVFQWTPGEAQEGIWNVTFRVHDNGSPSLGSDARTIQIDVRDVNSPPHLVVTNPPAVVKTTTLSAQVAAANDSDLVGGNPNVLSWSFVQTGGPTEAVGISFDPESGLLTWTPSADQAAGDDTFDLSVDDNTGSPNAIVVQPLVVTVQSAGIVDGTLLVVGTSSDDTLAVDLGTTPGTIVVQVNSESYLFDGADFSGDEILYVTELGGNDSLTMIGPVTGVTTTVDGGLGLDRFLADLSGDLTAAMQLLRTEEASLTLAGDLSGNLTAVEDLDAPGSGVINRLTIGGSITASGVVDVGALFNCTVAGDMAGTIIAHGAGTINGLNVGGSVAGTITALEDSNPGSGTIANTTVGRVSSGGTIDGGALTTIRVETDMAGTIIAHGAGTINGLNVGGSVAGTITALEDSNPGSGTMNGVTVGSVSTTGRLDGGALTTIRVETDMAGTIIAHGAETVGTFVIGGNLSGTVQALVDENPGSGKYESIQVGSVSGRLEGRDANLLNVLGPVTGYISFSRDINKATIATVSSTGSVSAGTVASLTMTGAISGNVADANLGTLQASNVSADGTTVLKVTEGNVERRIEAIPVNPSAGLPSGVRFSYFYDSTGAGDPQVVLRISTASPATTLGAKQFDVLFSTSTAGEFDLARLDSVGNSGIRNVVVEGDLLPGITAASATFLSLPANSAGGVQLSGQAIGGVAT